MFANSPEYHYCRDYGCVQGFTLTSSYVSSWKKEIKKMKFARLTLALALFLATFAVQGGTAGAAQGCTFAPGAFGAYQCTNANGDGLHVDSAIGIYSAGGNNVCDVKARFNGHPKNSSWSRWTYSGTNHGCTPFRRSVTKYINYQMKENSKVRGQVRSNHTSNYVGGAEVTIKCNWWDRGNGC